jgi:hypothetical protein
MIFIGVILMILAIIGFVVADVRQYFVQILSNGNFIIFRIVPDWSIWLIGFCIFVFIVGFLCLFLDTKNEHHGK